MIKLRATLLIPAAILIAIIGWIPSHAQSDAQRYFLETGHWVSGEFLDTYQKTADPIKIYGYPITDAFIDPAIGRQVQYFQKTRFEFHPEAPEGLQVRLTPLGEYLYSPANPLPNSKNAQNCQPFVETGYQVCYAFLDFFNENGNAIQFGYPISDFEYHNDRIVQYFQRALFEWHPELPPGERVVIADLGFIYFQTRGEDPSRLLPYRDQNMPQSILRLIVRSFNTLSLTGPSGSQTTYVIVQDQNLNPVRNAQVTLTIQLPSGNEERYVMPLTDEHGVTKLNFFFSNQPRGLVKVSITAYFASFQESTRTSFRIWW